MRLYNASSCTPVLAQTTNQLHQRQGPKTYLPKVAAPQNIKDQHQWEQVIWPHRRDDVDVDIEDCALDSPRAKSGASTTDIDKNFARNASALVQQVGLFPTRNSQNEGGSSGNAKAVRILGKDDVRYFNDNDQDDGITIASSSTLSTHTTLQQSVVEQEPVSTTCSSSSATVKEASYGISSPFPTTAYQSMKSRHILSPARTGRVVTVEKQQDAKPVTSRQETIPQTSHCEVDDHPDDEDDSFKVATTKESRSDLQTSSHFSSHVGFLRNIQGRLERCNIQDNRPSSRSSSMVNNDTAFRKIETSSSQEQNEYPCPQLSSTDCSSDESTWFDFSQQGSENPFHGPSSNEEHSASSPSGNGRVNKNQKNVHFTPIEKPPVSSRRRPLMTIKPRPTASRNNIQKQHSFNDDGIKDDIYHKNPKCFFPVKPQTRNFPTQSIKQRRRLVGASSAFPKGIMREPQEQDQQQRQPILLQGPRSDSAAMFPKAGIWNHHHHHFYESTSPDYSKYSAMFKSGITRDGVKQAMEEDGINQSIIDLVLQASTPRPSISTFQG